jgi:adenosylhomocysteine nucleosidase
LSGVGIVTALIAEARAVSPRPKGRGVPLTLSDGTLLVVSGIGHAAATSAARSLVNAGATALASFGLAGGLDPRLTVGTVFLPAEVISQHATFTTSYEWRRRLSAALTGIQAVIDGKLLTSSTAIAAVDAKAAAFNQTGASAVDMESIAVAQIAASHALPFLAVRVIVDTATDRLPKSVMDASVAGQLRLWSLIIGLLLAPTDLSAVVRLARRYRVANRSLRAVAAMRPLRQVAA